jgi:hypothetical protein
MLDNKSRQQKIPCSAQALLWICSGLSTLRLDLRAKTPGFRLDEHGLLRSLRS